MPADQSGKGVAMTATQSRTNTPIYTGNGLAVNLLKTETGLRLV